MELKAVETMLPIHEATLQSYLRATNLRVGLLLNFRGETLGIRRTLNPRAPTLP